MLDDIRKASGDVLSFGDASLDLLQMDHTMRYPDLHDQYHVDIVRGPLTRGFPSRFEDIKDEIAASFSDIIPEKDGESWAMHNRCSLILMQGLEQNGRRTPLLELSFLSFAGRRIDYSWDCLFVSEYLRIQSFAALTAPTRQES
jgi:hypothetical protein